MDKHLVEYIIWEIMSHDFTGQKCEITINKENKPIIYSLAPDKRDANGYKKYLNGILENVPFNDLMRGIINGDIDIKLKSKIIQYTGTLRSIYHPEISVQLTEIKESILSLRNKINDLDCELGDCKSINNSIRNVHSMCKVIDNKLGYKTYEDYEYDNDRDYGYNQTETVKKQFDDMQKEFKTVKTREKNIKYQITTVNNDLLSTMNEVDKKINIVDDKFNMLSSFVDLVGKS